MANRKLRKAPGKGRKGRNPDREFLRKPKHMMSQRERAILEVLNSQRARKVDLPKAAVIATLILASLALSIGEPLGELRPTHTAAAISGDTITVPGRGITGLATEPPPGPPVPIPQPGPDPGTMHVLYWMLLAFALIPLELELRKRNG